ncbi:hypothetical protein JTE90_005253 [Oedothorax gibbosus]|uniref:Thymidine phosphorylase n=1 Tax=Oedothorax gibbosus TaxID=931172 RepID=A0AAV6U7B2_9ARAC|nr:hypothetical protein JTE90_005253 [Oedothorax gibbosus]
MGDYELKQIIKKKQDEEDLSSADIKYFVDAVTKSIQNDGNKQEHGTADRCQIGAMLMAMYLKGLNDFETNQLTINMKNSGSVFDWPDHHKDRIVDKHSTGGVGDKTSLILAPALAACGLLVPMISGRSLNHTGGTLDKMEAIKGLSVFLTESEIKSAMDSVGCCIVGQTADCVPADKVLYHCRDITSTVNYPPLIISSIVSKKLSESPCALVYDVKFGKGAIANSKEEALAMAQNLVLASRPVKAMALLTSMEAPLGRAIGDSLELLEALECLKGRGPNDVIQLVEALGDVLLKLTNEAGNRILDTLNNGAALKKFHDMIILQKVDEEVAKELCYGDVSKALKDKAPYITKLQYTGKEGFVSSIDSRVLGNVWKEEYSFSNKNPGVGFLLLKVIGDEIKSGDAWAEFHHQRKELTPDQLTSLSNAVQVSPEVTPKKLIEYVVYLKNDKIMVEDY